MKIQGFRSVGTIRLMLVLCAVFLQFSPPALACYFVHMVLIWPKSERSSHPLFLFVENGKVGFIDADGHIAIEPRFEYDNNETGDFIEGLARVRLDGKWGYIDPSGQFVIPPVYDYAGDFEGGYAWVAKDVPGALRWRRLYLDHDGLALNRDDHVRLRLASGGLGVKNIPNEMNDTSALGFPDRQGYVGQDGNFLIAPQFARARPFSEGLAAVALDGECWLPGGRFGRSPSPSVPYASDCGHVSSQITEPCRHGFIDRVGEFVIAAEYEDARDFEQGQAAVKSQGKWGFIDRRGQFSIPPRYEELGDFRDGYALVKVKGLWGIIDRTGRYLVPPRFTKAEPFHRGFAEVIDSEKRIFQVDRLGRLSKLPGGYKLRTRFIFGLSHVRLGKNRWGYIRTDGSLVFEYHRKDNILDIEEPSR